MSAYHWEIMWEGVLREELIAAFLCWCVLSFDCLVLSVEG